MNILILTSEYPNNNSTYDTPVVHYFAKEWSKSGHQVKVIHFRSVFPIFFYWIASIFNPLIKKIVGTDFIPTKRLSKKIDSFIEGVSVKSVPIFKLFPHLTYSKKTINNHVNDIIKENEKNNFNPDIIIGHFYNPQIVVINKLKEYYKNAKTCLVLHEQPSIIKQKFPKTYGSLIRGIDLWGFRYKAMHDKFVDIYGVSSKTFICHSGVPSRFINYGLEHRDFDNKIFKYCFAGMLIPLKNVDITIESLNEAYPRKNFDFTIIGKGMEEQSLKEKVNNLNLNTQIHFHGRMSREKVQEYFSNSDCFVMASEPEAFGLVYLEAMAQGCITIGTRGQGIDGVIIDGFNGFLCESKNIAELSAIFKKLSEMPKEELVNISKNAINTAKQMTDEKVAQQYLETVINC